MLREPLVAVEVLPCRPDGYQVVRLTGEVDMASVSDLRAGLAAVDEHARLVVVDLDGLGFLSAAGLRELLELRERQEGRGGALHLLCGEHRPASLLLRALGVSAITALPSRPAPAVR